MSEWTDRVRGSAIWKAMEDLGPTLDNAERREGADKSAIEALTRLRTALAFVGKRLAAADPLLIQPGPLDNAATHFQNAITAVQQFIAEGSAGHLTNANTQVDSILAYVGQLNVPLGPYELQALKDAADRYRDAMESNAKRASDAVATTTAAAAELTTKLAELSAEMSAERQRLSSLTSEFQAQFSTAQEARNTDYTAAQAARQEKYAELVATATEALTKQDAAFTKEHERLTLEHTAAISEFQKQYTERAQGILTGIEKHRGEVEKLVGVIGNLGVTSGYLKTANEAKITVRVWQAIAVISMVVLIAVAYFTFLPSIQGTFSWESFAGRVFFTLTIGVLAAYAASQADKYISVERRNRVLALELEALGPYLAPLPEEKQQEFRLTLGDRTFGRDQGSAAELEQSPASVVDLLLKSKEFRTLVTESAKAARG